jgi:hypothetical protein
MGSDPKNGFKGVWGWSGGGFGKDNRLVRRIDRARSKRAAAREAREQFEDEIAGGDDG